MSDFQHIMGRTGDRPAFPLPDEGRISTQRQHAQEEASVMTSPRLPNPAQPVISLARPLALATHVAGSPFSGDVPEVSEEDLARLQDRITCVEEALAHLDGGSAPDPKRHASLAASQDPLDAATGALCKRSARLLRLRSLGQRIENVTDVAFVPLSLLSIALGPTCAFAWLALYAATVVFSMDGTNRAEAALDPCAADLERLLEEDRNRQKLFETIRDTREAYEKPGSIETHEESVDLGPVRVPRRPTTPSAAGSGNLRFDIPLPRSEAWRQAATGRGRPEGSARPAAAPLADHLQCSTASPPGGTGTVPSVFDHQLVPHSLEDRLWAIPL